MKPSNQKKTVKKPKMVEIKIQIQWLLKIK